MRLLVLGGTRFLGPHVVADARAKGHDVTIFHRGMTKLPVPSGVTEILGDRTVDLASLGGRSWDAVIDTCGYEPSVVERSVAAFHGVARRYVFVSTISTYGALPEPDVDETRSTLGEASLDSDDPATRYGARKALCEAVVRREFGVDGVSVRPGLIVGPLDNTDRFTYWVERLARGGDVLLPGSPNDSIQMIDVRDLASFVVECAMRGDGVYNVVGERSTLGKVFETGVLAFGSKIASVWVDGAFLLEHGVGPWVEMPLWLPNDPDVFGANEISARRALDAGLTRRPLTDTFVDTLNWTRTRESSARIAGLTEAREAELLSAWKARVRRSIVE